MGNAVLSEGTVDGDSSVVEIQGIVGATSACGVRAPPQKHYTVVLTLVGWRGCKKRVHDVNDEPNVDDENADDDEECCFEEVRVTMDTNSDEEYRSITKQLVKESLVTLRVIFPAPEALAEAISTQAKKAATLVEIVSPSELLDDVKNNANTKYSQKLIEYLVDYVTPIYRTDPELGEFRYDRSVGWFDGNGKWMGKDIKVYLIGNESEFEDIVSLFKTLAASETTWNEKILAKVIEKLLPLKNDYWLESDDEEDYTDERFLARVTTESIEISLDGSFSVYMDDGDLFFGHSIATFGSLANGVEDSDMMG